MVIITLPGGATASPLAAANRSRSSEWRYSLCSHVTALEPADRLKVNDRTQLTSLRSRVCTLSHNPRRSDYQPPLQTINGSNSHLDHQRPQFPDPAAPLAYRWLPPS